MAKGDKLKQVSILGYAEACVHVTVWQDVKDWCRINTIPFDYVTLSKALCISLEHATDIINGDYNGRLMLTCKIYNRMGKVFTVTGKTPQDIVDEQNAKNGK